MKKIANINYQAEIVKIETKELLSPVYYFGINEKYWRNGTIVKVSPKNMDPWFGCFMVLDIDPRIEKTDIYATEKSNNLLVLSGSLGYVVDVLNPDHWGRVPCAPILELFYLEEIDVYIFNDFQDICAWGPDGLLWRLEHFMTDDVLLTSVDADCIEGTATDCLKTAKFKIETLTGKVLSMESK